MSEDTSTRENGGEIPRWIERTSTGIPELGEIPGGIDLVFSTEAGSIVEQPMTSDINRHLCLKSPTTQIKKTSRNEHSAFAFRGDATLMLPIHLQKSSIEAEDNKMTLMICDVFIVGLSL